ncbi:MAG: hypothetical protein WCI27_01185 [Candidatus Omnitrophota bacterium]
MMYASDDYSYLAHATSLAFFQFPSYEREHFTVGDKIPAHAIGPGIMAAPFVFIFSLVDRVKGSDIVDQRSPDNLKDSWAVFGFMVATVFYFLSALVLFYRGLRFFFSESTASWSVILMILAQGAPLFVFRRPVFSHIYTLFLGAALLFLLLKILINKDKPVRLREMLLAGVLGGMTILVRTDNVVFAMAWVMVFWLLSPGSKKYLSAMVLLLSVGMPVFIFKILPGTGQRWQTGIAYLLESHEAVFYIKRLWHVLVGVDWGLIFTAPFLLAGMGAVGLIPRSWRGVFGLLAVSLLVNLFIVLQWETQGGWYGYRYLLFSAFPVFLVPFAFWVKSFCDGPNSRIAWVLFLLAVCPVLSMLFFEGNQMLTLALIQQPFGREGWGNNQYQLQVWWTLLMRPMEAVVVVAKGGVLYVATLLKVAPKGINVYNMPDTSLLIKVMIIYAMPFLFMLRRNKA